MILTAAFDHGDLALDRLRLDAHNGGYFFGSLGAACRAKTDRRFAVQHSLCICLTAREAAAAAVGAGERLDELRQTLVRLDRKDLGGNGEDSAEHRAHNAENDDRVNYLFHTAYPLRIRGSRRSP